MVPVTAAAVTELVWQSAWLLLFHEFCPLLLSWQHPDYSGGLMAAATNELLGARKGASVPLTGNTAAHRVCSGDGCRGRSPARRPATCPLCTQVPWTVTSGLTENSRPHVEQWRRKQP